MGNTELDFKFLMAEFAVNPLGRFLHPVRRMLSQPEKWVFGKIGQALTFPWETMPLVMYDVKDF